MNFFITRVIEIICCIAVLFHLYYLSRMPDPHIEVKVVYAKQDCDTLAQAIQKYNSLESAVVKSEDMNELAKKYITNLDRLRDRWGNRYRHDYSIGVVYSMGPDGKHDPDNAGSQYNKDDISVSYIGPPRLVAAALEVNPGAGNFLEKNDEERKKCYDRLHLYFNLDMEFPALPVNLAAASVNMPAHFSKTDIEAASGKIFRYFIKDDPETRPIPAPADLAAACGSDYSVCWGADSREIIIKLASGYTSADPEKKLLTAGTHFINLTGAPNNKNRCFSAQKSSKKPAEGAEAAAGPVLIRNYEK